MLEFVEKSQEHALKVRRIVSNIKTLAPEKAAIFYADIFGLELLMDQGWIRTYGSNEEMSIQVSFATEGGSGTDVPDLSIEVDDIDTILEKVKDANISIEYGPKNEPWGVRRFYIRDPFGKLINVLQHK